MHNTFTLDYLNTAPWEDDQPETGNRQMILGKIVSFSDYFRDQGVSQLVATFTRGPPLLNEDCWWLLGPQLIVITPPSSTVGSGEAHLSRGSAVSWTL